MGSQMAVPTPFWTGWKPEFGLLLLWSRCQLLAQASTLCAGVIDLLSVILHLENGLVTPEGANDA